MDQENNDIKVKKEVIKNDDDLPEENTCQQEKDPEEDIPEYINVNTFSNVNVKTEAPQNVQETFQCSQCPTKYKKMTYLTIHEALHDPRRFCPICYETFTWKKKLCHHLNQHIKLQMKEDKKLAFSCSYCQKSFDSNKKFTLHVRVHTNERPHKCEICGEGFKQLGTLKDHYVTHTKEKRFACEICNGCYTTSSSLKRHKRKMHEKGKTISCKHCDAKYLNMAAFRAHKESAHPNVRYKRTCPLCLEIFHSKCTYRNHKQLHDENQLPKDKLVVSNITKSYLCVLCGDKSFSLNMYIEHRRIHLDYTKEEVQHARKSNLFKCKTCSKEFPVRSMLFKHMDAHMDKEFKCSLCPNSYTYYGLNVHMRTSHQMVKCHVCRKVLIGRAKLYYHYQKSHPTVKRFGCSICSKRYVSRNQLNLHFKLIHENNAVKNFKCNVCGRRFLTRRNIASHMKHAHDRRTKYNCAFCEVVCDTRKELYIHHSTHKESNIEAYKLDGEKQLSGAAPKRFQCKTCKKIFQSSANCKIHLTSKTCKNFLEKRKQKQTTNNHRCKVCTVRFPSVDTLQQHMEVHSSSEFRCRICKNKYKMVRSMRRHVLLHHPGEKVFKCDICDEEFDRLNHYNKHRNKHKVKLEPANNVADDALDVKDTYVFNSLDEIKEEQEDPSIEHFNYE